MLSRNEILSLELLKSVLKTDLKDFDVTPEERRTAEHFLKDAPDGTKLSYSATPEGKPRTNKGKLFAAIEEHNSVNKNKLAQTTHSFIKLHGKIYAIAQGKSKDAILGKGGFGKVKLIKYGSPLSLIKIGKNTPVEEQVLRDLKISEGQHAIHYLESSEDNAKVSKVEKSALPMPFLGKTLFEVLHEVDKQKIELDDSTRLALATKLALAVYDLHALGFAHGDLKPENATIDANAGVHLIDFGLAKTDHKALLKNFEQERIVSQNYSPSFDHVNFYTAEQKDLFMLKKTIMMVADWELTEESLKADFPSILTEDLCRKFKLDESLSLLDARPCNELHFSAGMMAVLLLQAKLQADGFELQVSAEALLRDATLAPTIINLLKKHAQSSSKEVCEIINREVLSSKATPKTADKPLVKAATPAPKDLSGPRVGDAKPTDSAKPTISAKTMDACFLLDFFNHLSTSQKIALALFTVLLVASFVGIGLSTAGAGLIGAAAAGIVLKASIAGACTGGVGLALTSGYAFFSQGEEKPKEPSLVVALNPAP